MTTKSHKHWRGQIQAVWVISMVLSSTLLVLSDVFHPFSPKFPLQPTLILASILHCAGPILVTLLGREVHGKEKYLYFQPFAGGAVFVGLQCLGTILFIFSGALVLIFQALHQRNIHARLGDSSNAGMQQPPVLHGPLALAGIMSFASAGFLYRSVFVFSKPSRSTVAGEKGKSGAEERNGSGIWATLSTSPNAESLVVVLLSIGCLALSLLAPHLVSLGIVPEPLAHEHPWLLLAILAGLHLLAALLSHINVGWVHTPNYRLFMPFGLPKKTIVAQGTAWTGISLGCMMLVGMYYSTVNNTATEQRDNTYRLFGIISCGSNLCLLLNIRLTRHSASMTRSRANLAFHGPFVATTSAIVQTAMVLALHSGMIFPDWVGGNQLAGIPEWEGIHACQILAQGGMLWWPVITHLLGTFVHGKSYNIWAPFNGKADFVLAQAVGWVAFTLSLTCNGLFFAGGEMANLWSVTAVSAGLVSQILIHASVRIFVSPLVVVPGKLLVSSANKGVKDQQRPGPIEDVSSPRTKTAADEHHQHEVRFVNGEWLVGFSITVVAFFMFVACDRLGSQENAGDSARDFPLKSIVLVGTLCVLTASPFVQISGWDKFGMRAMFTPFQGSAEYVSLQAVGWTCYAILIVFLATHGMGLLWDEGGGSSTGHQSQNDSSFYSAIAWVSQMPFVLISASLFFECRNLQLDRAAAADSSSSVGEYVDTFGSPYVAGSPRIGRVQRGVSPRRTLSPSSATAPATNNFSFTSRSPATLGRATLGTPLVIAAGGGGGTGSSQLEATLAKLDASDISDLKQLATDCSRSAAVKSFLQEAISVAEEQQQQNNHAGAGGGGGTKRTTSTLLQLRSDSPSSPSAASPWWVGSNAAPGSSDPWEGTGLSHLSDREKEAITADAVSYAQSVAGATTFLSCMSASVMFGVAAWMRSSNQIPQSAVFTTCGMLICTGISFGLHAFYGPTIYTRQLYKLWQPFAGGPPFVALQAFGFGCVATADVLAVTTLLAPQGGQTALACSSILSAIGILAVYWSVRKFDVKAKAKPSGLLEKNAEAVVSVLLLAVSVTLGKVHEITDPFGDTGFLGDGSANTTGGSGGGTTTGGGGLFGGAQRSQLAVLSVAPLFLSFSALSLAVPLAAVAIRRASAQNQDLLDGPEDHEEEAAAVSVTTPTKRGTRSNKKNAPSTEKRSNAAGGGGVLVSAFAVGIKVIAPVCFIITPLLVLYGLYYALQSSTAIALAILQSGGMVLSLSLGALGVLAMLKVREDFITWFFAVCDYGIPTVILIFLATINVVRPVYISRITFLNGCAFTLFPDGARPITIFANVVMATHFFMAYSATALQACGWWGFTPQDATATAAASSAEQVLVFPEYYCLSWDAAWEIYVIVELVVGSLLMYKYARTWEGDVAVNGKMYHHEFTMWFRRVMVPHKVKWYGLTIHCENKDGKPISPDQQVLYGYHPHGVIPAAAGWILHTEDWQKKISPKFVSMHGAGVIMKAIGMRELPLRLGCRNVTKLGINNSFDDGNSVSLVPGGQAELIVQRCSMTQLRLVTRHVGFIRVALLRRLPVCPILCFGEQDLLDNVHCESIQKYALKMTGVAFPVLPFGACYGPFPRRKKLTVVVGEPVYPPEWYLDSCKVAAEELTAAKKKESSSTRAGGAADKIREGLVPGALTPEGREAKAVDEVAEKYWAEVKRIFEKHKVAAGYPDQKLVLEDRKRQFQPATMIVPGGANDTSATTTAGGGGGSPLQRQNSSTMGSSKNLKKQKSSNSLLYPSAAPGLKSGGGGGSASFTPPASRQATGVFDPTESELPRTESSLSPGSGGGKKKKK